MDNLGRTTFTFSMRIGERFEIHPEHNDPPLVVEIFKGDGRDRLTVSVTSVPTSRVRRPRPDRP